MVTILTILGSGVLKTIERINTLDHLPYQAVVCIFGLGHFADLAVVAFDGVGIIDQAADGRWVVKVGGQILPIVLLGSDGSLHFPPSTYLE